MWLSILRAEHVCELSNLSPGKGRLDTVLFVTESRHEIPNARRQLKAVHEPAGYSANTISVWSYPGLQRIATLGGHTQRVLYLALSPDGRSIVTGAGATLRRDCSKQAAFPRLQLETQGGAPDALPRAGPQSCYAQEWPHNPGCSAPCTKHSEELRALCNFAPCPGSTSRARGEPCPTHCYHALQASATRPFASGVCSRRLVPPPPRVGCP